MTDTPQVLLAHHLKTHCEFSGRHNEREADTLDQMRSMVRIRRAS